MLSKFTNLTTLLCFANLVPVLDASSLTKVTYLNCRNNVIVDFNAANLFNVVNLRLQGNRLNNLVNSQILIDLDANGKTNGYFQTLIFGGGTLTSQGLVSKGNLQVKVWTVVGA